MNRIDDETGNRTQLGAPGPLLRPTQADPRQLPRIRHLISGPLLDPRHFRKKKKKKKLKCLPG